MKLLYVYYNKEEITNKEEHTKYIKTTTIKRESKGAEKVEIYKIKDYEAYLEGMYANDSVLMNGLEYIVTVTIL